MYYVRCKIRSTDEKVACQRPISYILHLTSQVCTSYILHPTSYMLQVVLQRPTWSFKLHNTSPRNDTFVAFLARNCLDVP